MRRSLRARAPERPVRGKMNKLEESYSQRLELMQRTGTIVSWAWEPMKLKLGRDWKTTYTPDFLVVTPGGYMEFHEVKGFMEEDANVKIKVAAKDFPWFTFVLARLNKKVWEIKEYG